MTPSLLTVRHSRAPVAIIGVGNVLMGDDAFGPLLLRDLETHPRLASFGDRLEFVDAGTAGFDLMHQLLGRERVIVLDAVAPRNDESPGTVRVLQHEELLAMAHRSTRGTPHEPSILAAIHVAELAGELPDVTLVGVVPADTTVGMGLSKPVAAARAAAVRAAVTAVTAVTTPRVTAPG